MTILIETLTQMSCGECNLPFAMPTTMYNDRVRDGQFFWCPNGHKIHFYRSEMQELQEQVQRANREATSARARADQAHAEAAHQRRRAATYKGQVTKALKRAGNGVCPMCKRSFPALADHMHTKHPEACT